MNTRRMSDAQRRTFYDALIRKQRSSSLSVPDFCKRHNLSVWTFYQWRKKLAAVPQSHSPSQPSFVPLALPHATPAVPQTRTHEHTSAEIILESGIRLRLPADYPPRSTQVILDILLEQR